MPTNNVVYTIINLNTIYCVVKVMVEQTLQNIYCNMCGFNTARKMIEGEPEACPYHQEISYSDDGELNVKWEEFNQDGEEW